MIKLSVVIPCYNAADTIVAQLEALCHQTWAGPWEVIVADNGSSDGSWEVAALYGTRLPKLQVVDASAYRGTSYARNTGAQAATGDVLLFCDADDEVAPGWLTAMGEALAQYDFVACRCDIHKLNAPELLSGRGNPQQDRLGRLQYPPFTLYAGGGTLGVKRSIHEAIGGFDVTMQFLEDTEYCLRIQCSGTELHFVPDAVMYCRFPATLPAIYRQAYNWAQYNVLLYKRWNQTHWRDWSLWQSYLCTGVDLIKVSPRYHRSWEGRAVLLARFGRQMGLLKGSLVYRIPPVTL